MPVLNFHKTRHKITFIIDSVEGKFRTPILVVHMSTPTIHNNKAMGPRPGESQDQAIKTRS